MSNKPTVLLTMIVRNEGQIIERCLESAKRFIDGYFVIDTGSTDDTEEVIRRVLADFPGQILHEEWVNFGHNRTSLVEKAREQGYDYMLLADADMVFDGPDGCLDNLTEDSYLLRLAGAFEWHMPYLVSTRPHWRYHGVTHEFLTAPEEFVSVKHPDFIIHHYGDGGNRPDKLPQDRRLLEAEYERDPSDVRTVFYLAQTCKDMGETERAIELYKHRAALGGWDEEVYWSLYQVAEMTGEIEDYIRAWDFRPSRPEAIHKLMKLYNEKGLHRAAYIMGTLSHSPWYPEPTTDILFVERYAEDYAIKFEYCIASWWIGLRDDAINGFRELLKRDDLAPNYVEACKNNLIACGATEEQDAT